MEGRLMGQVRHGCATTTHAIRAATQRSQASNGACSDMASRGCRTWTATSPGDRGSSATRSAFSTSVARQAMHASPRGDIAELRKAEGKLYLFAAIDRTSKFAVAQLVEKADRKTAWEFLELLLDAVPYRIHTILTDNSIQFAEQPRNRNTIISRPMRFDMICEANGIEHRLTKPNHPWTNGQVERMNRTIKDATVKRYHYDGHDQLRTHLADFMAAYNFARRLKTLGGLTPYEYICKIWTDLPLFSGPFASRACSPFVCHHSAA